MKLLLLLVIVLCQGCGSLPSDTPAGLVAKQIYYLELVTKEVDAVCAAHAAANGLRFAQPDAKLGNARVASLPGGGMIGVRGPMRADETPVARSYILVDDIDAAVAAAEAAGGKVAHPPMAIPGFGTFSIYILGGIEQGLIQR